MGTPQDFRSIMLVGRSKRDVLSYSGNQLVHPEFRDDGRAPIRWRVIFWFWVPPGQRCERDFKTEVKDAHPHELAALRCGELEEVALNVTFPGDMKTADASQYLKTEWQARCLKRLGMIPEKREQQAPQLVGAEARAMDQAHSRIVIATR
jgi:hypothetical protein